MQKPDLDFIGIGVDRGATYWITASLKEHPEIQFSKQKEIAFFNEYDQHFLETKNPRYSRGLSWYANFFPKKDPGKKMGEYTPTYIFSEKAAKRIKKHYPNIKLITTLRDPVERAFSQYLHDLSIGVIPTEWTFEETLKNHKAYFEKGNYAKYLRTYFKIFGRENILVILVDDIKKNPGREMKRLYKFLKLKDTNFKPEELKEKTNPASVSRFPLLNRFLIETEIWMIQHKLNFLHQLLEDSGLRKFAFWLTYNLNRKKLDNKVYPKIDPATEEKLRKKYKRAVESTERLIRKRLSPWKKGAKKR